MNQSIYRSVAFITAAWLAICPVKVTAQIPEISPDMMAKQQALDAKLQIPFDFYGKVVDESGQAVPGATANIYVMGELGKTEGETKHMIESDASGLFSLRGIRSFGVIVTVCKNGYLSLSNGHVGAYEPGKDLPGSTNPAIFSLQQKHVGQPSIAIKKSASFPEDGTPLNIDLERGRTANSVASNLKIEAWVDGHDHKSQQPFHWKLRLTVPGGGLQPASENSITAPSSGYQESYEADMVPGSSNWRDGHDQAFFVKLADGKYGRIKFFITPSGDHFFKIDGALNPSGSQDIE